MSLTTTITSLLHSQFEIEIEEKNIQLQPTRKDFEGDITLVVFPLVRQFKKSPEETGKAIGEALVQAVSEIEKFNVVKGFLNLSYTADYWLKAFAKTIPNERIGYKKPNSSGRTILVEYSSPNTNKPLHLGHLRNNFLGYSVAEILKAQGHEVKKVQIINDRGIHICKSMVSWLRFGEGETPSSSGKKGDQLVGEYYVKFDQEYKKEIKALTEQGMPEEIAKKQAPIFLEAQEMLRQWERGEEKATALWKKMNSWVYDGFEETYSAMGVDFDKLYYESETYLLGKEIVQKGVEKGLFYQKEDGSIWVDLSDEGLDNKLLLRADGTAVYMTQDIGTAILRKEDYPNMDQLIYTVGNEQDYHFKVLFKVLEKLGYDFAKNCFHLSYGMVDLPTGKMKSREGTVVDADDLMVSMVESAAESSKEHGKIDDVPEEERGDLFHLIGLAALKYFILKVDPKKRMLFNPAESIDFNGNTGPFIQYTYARIQAIHRRYNKPLSSDISAISLEETERTLIKKIDDFSAVLEEAAENYSPAVIANYVYDLVKAYNHFYQNAPIFGNEKEDFRVALSVVTGRVVKNGMQLLGIGVPVRM